ncbi:hypothetical protein ACQKNB_09345 [Lysinibacillus xylanilyticus]|uniref:hypothetical protein n=1 Tax=Lysinibacillus xylanilyticus TaxID=582475 RepID=UPI003D071291
MTEKQVTSEVKEFTQEEVNNLVEKALANQSVQTLINNSLNYYPSIKAKITNLRALITKSLGGEFTKGTTPVQVLQLVMEELKTVITFTIENSEFKALSHFHGNSNVIEVSQAVGESLFSITTININEGNFEYEWHSNPLYDVNELSNSSEIKANEVELKWSACSTCTTVCDTIQNLGCGIASTLACMMACAPIGTLACPIICAAVFILLCTGDNKILCGPGCKSLGYCK